MCLPRYPISPGSTGAPFALLEWPSDDPERVSVHAGLTPSTVPVGRSPMRPFSPARCVPDRWASGLHRPSAATTPPPGTTSPSRPRRQTVRAGERGIRVHVPGPPCKPHGGDGRTARRMCAADVRRAGRLRSADPPASPGVRAPLRTPTVACVLRSPRSGQRCGLCNLGAPRPAVNRLCAHPAIAVPAGRRSAVAAPYGKCGEITYSYRRLQTPGALRRLRNRSFGHGIRAPGPRARHSVRTPRPATECMIWPHLPQTQRTSHDIDVKKRRGRWQV